ncbi:MAG: HTH-type transcriptional activator Btr [Candidatus Ordinivivax streblomastigis]|uniref:HTH-type transcriptional activator Btr n=1 Tax=Candidatus Ordinivivax streblomastigis TaxID=2540710 RepID=A0A5M8P5E7_9BACT|nr:MAG: HTH-type transcriptional activator Btr [Candidatus Ordinivivax streblomastigis]
MRNAVLLLLFVLLLPFTAMQATEGYRFRTMSPEGGFSYDGVVSVMQDNDGFIWVLIEEGLYRFDGYQYKEYYTRFTSFNPTKEWLFQNMTLDDSGQLFVRTNNGVYCYDEISDTFLLWEQDVRIHGTEELRKEWIDKNKDWLPQEILKRTLRAFCVDKNGNCWLGYRDGLYVVNPVTKTYTRYVHDEADAYSLPNSNVWTIQEDRQKNLWIGTYSGMMAYVNLDEKRAFGTFYPILDKTLNYPVISAFAEDRQSWWVGTEGGGINRMNKRTGQFTYFTYSENQNSLSANMIKSMVVDKNQNLWIATFTGGLDSYNPKTNQFQHFKNEPKNPKSILFNNLRKIVLAGDSGLWVSYQKRKEIVSYFSFQTQTFTHYDFTTGDQNYYLFDMVRGEKQLWLLNSKNLYRMDLKTRKIEVVQPKDTLFMNFFTASLDDSGNLWLGTIGNGLVKYDTKTSDFTLYKDILKYNITAIYSICCSNNGSIWMGTDNGLIGYNIEKNAFVRYDEKDGTQGRVYYPFAVTKSAEGKLYFGGTRGFTVVDPLQITYNIHQPRVLLSAFLIDNKPMRLGQKIGKTEIWLNHNQANFGFQLSSDNYLMPGKTQFKYRLKGYDEHWIEIDASGRTALYAQVPAGNYTFEAFAANNDGVWSNTPSVVKIHVKPAPWLSWWAYVIYSLIVLGILSVIVNLYLKMVEKNKNEELHKIQMCFYKDYFVNVADTASSERDKKFLEDFVKIVESNIQEPKLDVKFIAYEMSMSRSTLYNKIKALTGKSIIEFILHQRLRKAANLMIETNLTMRQIINEIGIESQSYFSNAFKKEFGETPTSFASNHKG